MDSIQIHHEEGNPFDKLVIVMMQSRLQKVITKGNQILLVVSPSRRGMQIITLRTNEIQPSHTKEALLIQEVTTSGDEIDYTLQHLITKVDRN